MLIRVPFRGFAALCAIVVASFWIPEPVEAGEAYYLLMFGSQQIPNNVNHAHTFATFVRVTWPGDGPCPAGAVYEAHTISWLPANLVIRTGALCAEPGHNFELHETIEYVRRNGERVSMWGPYLIEPELFEKALRKKARLESGTIRYKSDDSFRKDNRVTNCIH
ncbi:MAG TPA: hypothetical protein VFE62_18060, partial [Gemmataceae bacterium]|nr:hypothetical protein [Gemmataceae bacterium]